MIQVDLWTQIRNMYYNQRCSQRKIARTLNIHRSTVKRAITTRGGPRYERTAPYQSVLDPFKAEIRQMIADANSDIMATVIYERLVQREDTPLMPRYCGSYETLCGYIHQVKGQRAANKQAFLRIETPPGFDAQCDWGKVNLVIDGQSKRLSMFVLTLSYSRFRYARLFFTERQEFFFTGHIEAFEFFDGLPQQVTYDNLRTAVAKILKGTNRQEQEAFLRFRGEFPFEANFAAPRKGNEKGKVESAIKYIRSHAFAVNTTFSSLSAANTHLQSWLTERDAKRVHSTHKQVIYNRYQQERAHLKPLPKPMPPCYRVVYALVNKFSFIQFETNRYSVPTAYVAETVMIKAFEQRILIFKGDKTIASHRRLMTRHQEVINPYHFLALLEQKARAVDHAVVMDSLALDPIFYQLKAELAKVEQNPNRAWIKILRLTEQYPMEQLVKAVKAALAHGVTDYSSIVNLLTQQVRPQVSLDAENSLVGHSELATLVVPPPTLTGYDILLAGEGEQ